MSLCWECDKRERQNFSTMCAECYRDWKEASEREALAKKARMKLFRYKGMHYADECATCHGKETVLWIISFKEKAIGGEVTGTWCETCIAGMVGKPEITSGVTFRGIHNIQFIKKCYEPPVTKAMQDVCDILKAVDF